MGVAGTTARLPRQAREPSWPEVAPRPRPFVGRERELAGLTTAMDRPPALVLIEGEAGIGKTRLVTELAARPELAGRGFVIGSCRRIREPFPLGPVVDVARKLGDHLRTATLSPVAGALRPLLPEIADGLPPQPPPLADRDAERHRVFRGLVELLASLNRAIVALEDLHWADEHTVDFLSYLLADPPPALSLVLTFRGDEVHPEVRALTAKLPGLVTRYHSVLTPLDAEQTGELAAAVLDLDRVSTEFAVHLCERSCGLPLAIEELLALLQARGTLVRSDGGWTRRALAELDVPAGIRDPVLERLRRLSGDARSVAEAAAVLQVPVPASVLAATCRTAKARAARGLDEALESRLLAEHGDAVGFRHTLAAQAIYDAIPRPRRQELHVRAAFAIGNVRPPPLGQLAHHLRHAGRLEEWVDAAERAADHAIELGHDAEAARLLEEVLRHGPLDADRQGRVAVKLARAASQTLRCDEVIDLLTDVVERDLPATVRSELRFRLALLLDATGGELPARRRLVLEAVDGLDERPDLKAWAMVCLGTPASPETPRSEQTTWLRRALEILPEVADPTFEVFVLGKVAMVLASIGDPAWRHLTERVLDQTDGSPRQRREVNAYYSIGVEACFTGRHDTADRLLTAGREGVVACDSRKLELRLGSALVLLDYCRGCWDGLADRIGGLRDELPDYSRARVIVEAVAGCVAVAHGDLDDARYLLARVLQRAEQPGEFDLLALPATALTRALVVRGEVEAAVVTARRSLAAMQSNGLWALVPRVLPVATEAMVAGRQVAEARALVARYARALSGLDVPLGVPATRYAQGVLAAAERRWATAARHFETAADGYERLLCPYEAAQAREQAAVSLLATGNAPAEATLRSALATYQRLGATWDASRASSIARRYGVSVPVVRRGGHRGYGTSLSPREREVAELAANGHTNKEIAQALFVSPNTVNKHIRAVLRKLGVRSRVGLAHQFAGATRSVDGKNGQVGP